jgi:hypothetical protein
MMTREVVMGWLAQVYRRVMSLPKRKNLGAEKKPEASAPG